MTIANDAWIRRMAVEKGMITPFQEGLVSKGTISYGLSSYGYDVRVARNFKIFHNLNSTLVDPKQFDARSFVDHVGDSCIIPPNSFVLAETVERFRIPRDVLCVCLGKCVTGDTRVVDAETGEYLPIREFAGRRSTLGLEGWRASRLGVSAFVPQGRKPVFELTTRLGHRIRATENHPFRTIDGWTPLSALRAGDRIAAAREVPVFGSSPLPEWEATLLGLMVSEGQCHAPGHSPTFTNFDPVLSDLAERCVAEGLGMRTTEASDGVFRLVNHAGRGGVPEPNRATLWLRRHGIACRSAEKSVPAAVFRAPRAAVATFLRALFSGDGSVYASRHGVFFEYASMSRRLVEDVHHLLLRFGLVTRLRSKRTAYGTTAHRVECTDRDVVLRIGEEIGFWPGSEKHVRLETEILPALRLRGARKSNFDTLPPSAWSRVSAGAARTGVVANRHGVGRLSSPQSLPRRLAASAAAAFDDPELGELATSGPVWDVVESIVPAGEDEVFDLTVPGGENFLANGLFVHNSTYARCFAGDTRVALVDGTAPTLEEMAGRADEGETFFGYSVGEHGRVVVTLLDRPRWIARDGVIEVEIDNGERIVCTQDHEFLRRDGTTTPAHALRLGDSLMPLYRELIRGSEAVYQPRDGRLLPTHRLADEWNVRNGLYGHVPGTRRHHVDHDRRNNAPWNIRRVPVREHILHHDAEMHGPEFEARGATSSSRRNHKVTAVRALPGERDVYCLTVPEAGNFALEAGVFVRNCGIIVNVTPLEPEWEGIVTIEISNTTPLPAKIYANEGIAQILFLRAAPDGVCETSYGDRKGKYQNQAGLTLPKVSPP
jgi:deoxycytidine triphosphate deaminase/intein/homing endonuclease